ncbi:hypothetical protein IW150_001441 [Coemansia sp. RSA 2607]|nr:hypothetical protein IW150_001441 [Coemansia sp. RSA 2607]
MAESSHSQRKSKSTSSGTTPDDATAIDAAADANGNDSNVDNELDLEDEDAFVDTKTVVETQLVLLAPDLPNRDVIVSAPMSFEAMISSSESLSTKSHMWAIISISIMPLLL